MPTYHPKRVEPKWQAYWAENKTFRAPDLDPRPKYYVLDMFPYPSGSGLHVGHPEGYTATDILARYKRARGFNVLHPMGWDAFGLPAEQYAIRTGAHPAKTTAENIATFKRQVQSLGFSYDWDREVDTTDPRYYKWTQWIFLQLYNTWYDAAEGRGRPIDELPVPPAVRAAGPRALAKHRDGHRLAYVAEAPVNWCPELGTVLANEEVKEGVSEVGGHPVERRPMRQWMLRITAYAERLLNDLDGLDWSESLKTMQRNWIGRSEGAEVDFPTELVGDAAQWRQRRGEAGFPGTPETGVLRVYTTRPDTLYGATYMVLAPEHALVDAITAPEQREAIVAYRQQSAFKSDFDRTEIAKEKTGVFTGAYAVNPVNDERIPVWIADYVLISYGTGAIMAVPAHDERDYEFAVKFGLQVTTVVAPTDGAAPAAGAFCDEGIAVHSERINGLPTQQAKRAMIDYLAQVGLGRGRINYKLRDWLFSRQRYWGEPFPILLEADGGHRAVEWNELPVALPELSDYRPTGTPDPPLSKAVQWLSVEREGERFHRETNTMPQWAGSCWYYLRYLDPKNDVEAWDKAKEKYWMPVDLYVGGAEHAVLHLLYARFWHKVLFDLGYVSCSEPFRKLVNQGMILGENNEKMSKARGNVVNPDVVVEEYGADSLRLYEMFMGPLEAVKPWNTKSVEGVWRFLNRAWRLVIDDRAEAIALAVSVTDEEPTREHLGVLHRTIRGVTEDVEAMRFNTGIAKLMEYVNFLNPLPARPRGLLTPLVLLLAPFAPHIAEEMWQALGGKRTLAYEPWPSFDAALCVSEEIEVAVQVNGKVRSKLNVPTDADDAVLIERAGQDEKVREFLAGKQLVKSIVVASRKGKLVSFVVQG